MGFNDVFGLDEGGDSSRAEGTRHYASQAGTMGMIHLCVNSSQSALPLLPAMMCLVVVRFFSESSLFQFSTVSLQFFLRRGYIQLYLFLSRAC